MGVDFVEKATPTFKKSWDKGRLKLATADLFTGQTNCEERTFAADLRDGSGLVNGETVIVEKEMSSLVVRVGLTEVARSDSPPPTGNIDCCGAILRNRKRHS